MLWATHPKLTLGVSCDFGWSISIRFWCASVCLCFVSVSFYYVKKTPWESAKPREAQSPAWSGYGGAFATVSRAPMGGENKGVQQKAAHKEYDPRTFLETLQKNKNLAIKKRKEDAWYFRQMEMSIVDI